MSNDGEYATVSIHEAGFGGGYSDLVVKRNNQWIVVYAGNAYGSCAQVKPLREKYNISPKFLPCGEEIGQ